MKLFTKDIDKKLFAQYSKGADLENQKVIAKIFNPYGRGRWYLLNSDPNDPDYIWAIVQMDDDIDVGSVSRRELENIKVPPFRLGLERDIYFSEVNAAELFKGLFSGKFYKSGGEVDIAEQNKDMLINYAEELEHHTEEFEEAAKKAENVEPWVVAKIERSTTDLSDVTHYLDSENEKRREYGNGEGEEMAKGGETKVEDVVYIQFRNAKKKFAIDKKYFRGDDAYMDAVKWGRKNIPNFNMDMVKFEMEKGAELDFGDFYEWSNKEVKNKFGSSFNEGFPLVKFVKDSGNKKVENASGVLKNGKNVVFDVEEVEWEIDDKMAKGGEIAKVGEPYDSMTKYQLEKEYKKLNEKRDTLKNKYGSFDSKEISENEKEIEKIITLLYGEDFSGKGQKFKYAKGGVMADSEYKKRIKQFGFKPFGKTKGIYTVTYLADGKSQSEKHESKEMAISAAKRYSSPKLADEFSDVKVFDEKGKEIKMAKGGESSNLWVIYTKQWLKKPEIIEEFTSTHKTAKNKLIKLQRSKPNSDVVYLMTDKADFYEKYGDKMAKGGVTFADKVKSIKSSLLKRKKVSPKVQKDYGKTYSPAEAEDSAKRIVGAMTAKERLMKRMKKGKK